MVNYRPVPLLPLIPKVLERVIFWRVVTFVRKSLYYIQHGVRANRSCVTQLLQVLHVGSALDAGKEIDLRYLHFAKAFDSVSHGKLIEKLQRYGISGSLLRCFADYLSSRKQCVVVA